MNEALVGPSALVMSYLTSAWKPNKTQSTRLRSVRKRPVEVSGRPSSKALP